MFELDFDLDDADFAEALGRDFDRLGEKAASNAAKRAADIAANLSAGHYNSSGHRPEGGPHYANAWFYREAPPGGVASVGNRSPVAELLEYGAERHDIPGPLKIPGRFNGGGTVGQPQVRAIFGKGGSSRRGRRGSGNTFIPEGKVVDHPGFTGLGILRQALEEAFRRLR